MRNSEVSVLVVEDEPVFMERFCDSVRAHARLELCGCAGTVREACALADMLDPDVVLVDLGLPDGNGIDVVRHVKAHHPRCEALVVSMFGDDGRVVGCIQAGATGYLLKDAGPTDIATSILQVCAGCPPLSPAIARHVLEVVRHEAQPRVDDGMAHHATFLSGREAEVLRLVAKGLNFKEIGVVLNISPNTVVTHVKSIYQKLSVHSRGEAVYEAGQLGLL